MKTLFRISVFFNIAALVIFAGNLSPSASAFAGKPEQPRYIEILSSQSTYQQESIGTGPLYSPTSTFNLTKPTLFVNFQAVVKCGSSGNGLARNFTVSIRVDGVVVQTIPYSVADNGYDYQYQVVNINATINGLSGGNHLVDIFVNAGGETVVIFSTPTSPAVLTVTQA